LLRLEFFAPCVIVAASVIPSRRRRIMTPSVVARVRPSPSTSKPVRLLAMYCSSCVALRCAVAPRAPPSCRIVFRRRGAVVDVQRERSHVDRHGVARNAVREHGQQIWPRLQAGHGGQGRALIAGGRTRRCSGRCGPHDLLAVDAAQLHERECSGGGKRIGRGVAVATCCNSGRADGGGSDIAFSSYAQPHMA